MLPMEVPGRLKFTEVYMQVADTQTSTAMKRETANCRGLEYVQLQSFGV